MKIQSLYKEELNPAQYEAATHLDGPVLVIAGAGSGKTRTVVYRLVHLIESGIPASQILLLTFTKKAAQEMIFRARDLLKKISIAAGHDNSFGAFSSLQGGTFHSYAYSILRIFQPSDLQKRLTVMDNHDILAALQHCRETSGVAQRDKKFPKNQTLHGLLSKSRNKETDIEEILRQDSYHLLSFADEIKELARLYAEFKRSKGLLDYDDLLFELERVFLENPQALAYCQNQHRYLMVDEYQDTNPVQARLACLISGLSSPSADSPSTGSGNLMLVGDDAQSIYAFRGADVKNIFRFPELFPQTKLIKLEENYRSTQGILNIGNCVLSRAKEGFSKNLFTNNGLGELPRLIFPLSDRSQASLVAAQIIERLRHVEPKDIAVLFRSGFHSYSLELELNKLGIHFKKYGGIRYSDAAHIKDVMSFIRLIQNPLDFIAFSRLTQMHKGIGVKTSIKLYQCLQENNEENIKKQLKRYPELEKDLLFLDTFRASSYSPQQLCNAVIEHYQDRLENLYPDDYPKRQQGLEEFVQLAAAYSELDMFIADLSLDDHFEQEEKHNCISLSTIHSAKGLEWDTVILIDLIEDRFPSKKSLTKEEDFEEERRLMYVACTRAKRSLSIYSPITVFDRNSGGSIPAIPSPFVRELGTDLVETWSESYTSGLVKKSYHQVPSQRPLRPSSSKNYEQEKAYLDERDEHTPISSKNTVAPERCGYCHHKIFGRGKIIQYLDENKIRVNFPGFGPKVILASYVSLEPNIQS